ncbi:MAG: transposase [Acidobacteriota bacterium]|jgi:transposase|nr:transposase [Acidobacteriota bacterium]
MVEERRGAFSIEGWDFIDSDLVDGIHRIEAVSLGELTHCPRCGHPVKKNGTKHQEIKDTPFGRHPARLIFNRQRFICLNPDKKQRHTSLQPLTGVDKKHRATTRLIEHIKAEAFQKGKSFASVARETGLSEKTLRIIFNEYKGAIQNAARARTAPYCIGMDEVHLTIGEPFVLVDNINKRVIDILGKRNKTVVKRRLLQLPGWQYVKVATMDMHRPYRDAVHAALPDAVIVIDHFHVVDMANDAVNAVRIKRREGMLRRERREVLRDRKLLWKSRKELSPQEKEDLRVWLKAMPDLRRAYFLKQRFKRLWSAPTTQAALRRYEQWRKQVPEDLLYAFNKLLTATDNWKYEIFNVIDYPYTNAFTERVNRDIRKLYRDSNGCSLDVLRTKMLAREYKSAKARAKQNQSSNPNSQCRRKPASSNTTEEQSGVVHARYFQPLLPLFQREPEEE